MLPRGSLHARCTEPQGLPAGSDLDHRRAGLDAAGKLAPERQNGPLETSSDLFEGHTPEHHLRRPRDDAERVWPREQPPEDDSRDPVVLADHVAGIRDRRPVLDDRSAQIDLPGPVGTRFKISLLNCSGRSRQRFSSLRALKERPCHRNHIHMRAEANETKASWTGPSRSVRNRSLRKLCSHDKVRSATQR